MDGILSSIKGGMQLGLYNKGRRNLLNLVSVWRKKRDFILMSFFEEAPVLTAETVAHRVIGTHGVNSAYELKDKNM